MRLQLKSYALAAALTIAWSSDALGDGALAARATSEVAAYSDSDHVAVLTPSIAGHVENPTAGWSADGSYTADVISAASVDIVSTASRRWTELRQAGSLRGAYQHGDWGGSVAASLSNEPDYLAYAAGGTLKRDFDQKNWSLLAGYGAGHDLIGRAGTSYSVYHHSFDHHVFTLGATSLIDASTVFSLTGDLTLEMGDSSKPYRYVPLFSAVDAASLPAGATIDVVNRFRLPFSLAESLPLTRQRFVMTAMLARRFAHATARVLGAFYDDSWSVKGLTSDARLLCDLGDRWSAGPHARYYVQSSASFWRLAYTPTIDASGALTVPTYRTGDRELGPLMNLTGGASARWALGPASNLRAWQLGGDFDVIYTRFLDDLYITRRLGVLASLSAEASW